MMDHDFIEQYDLELVTGRIFNGEMSTDSASCVLNEQGVLRLGLGSPEEALGTELDFWGDKLTVVGVVKNFHQQSGIFVYTKHAKANKANVCNFKVDIVFVHPNTYVIFSLRLPWQLCLCCFF